MRTGTRYQEGKVEAKAGVQTVHGAQQTRACICIGEAGRCGGVLVVRSMAKERKGVQIMEIPVCNQEPDSPHLPENLEDKPRPPLFQSLRQLNLAA